MEIKKHILHAKPFLMIGAGLITGLALPLLHHRYSVWMPGLIICALGLGDWLFPHKLDPLWRLLEKSGKTIAHYNSIFLLSLAYLLAITPAGIFFQWRRSTGTRKSSTHSFYENPESRESGHMRRMF